MKWLGPLFKFLGGFKELIIAIAGYFFGFNRGVEHVENKVIKADFAERKKRRDQAKKILNKWDRIRSDTPKLPGEADNDNAKE